jgi:hypothetical protein
MVTGLGDGLVVSQSDPNLIIDDLSAKTEHGVSNTRIAQAQVQLHCEAHFSPMTLTARIALMHGSIVYDVRVTLHLCNVRARRCSA